MFHINPKDVHGVLAPYQKQLQAATKDDPKALKNMIDQLAQSSVPVSSFDPLPVEIFEKELNINSGRRILK